MSATKTSPFQILLAIDAYPRNIPGNFFFCQIGGALTGHVKKSDNIQPLIQKESLGLLMVLRIVFYKEFFRLQEGFEHFADGNSIP